VFERVGKHESLVDFQDVPGTIMRIGPNGGTGANLDIL
jgi:hypothetical protein